jgi:hypothetical protein
MKKLPWDTNEYKKLDPADLKPFPAPTPEQRVRVAAALATRARDCHMLGEDGAPNVEVVRAVLMMDAKAWARDIGSVAKIVTAYDDEDPKTRWEQTAGIRS